MYELARAGLFRLDPERAHDLTLALLTALSRTRIPAWLTGTAISAPRTIMGIEFPNPVGLAAGLDKDGLCIDGLAALGFGFIEIGTVTPVPQSGNPRPRVFRIAQAEAIINRMGFNNAGVERLVEHVRAARYRGILGINIGKNRHTPMERAAEDYLLAMRSVYPHASYVTVNVSSPNTPGLRELQRGDALDRLLAALKSEQQRLAIEHDRYVPITVKIAPDLSEQEVVGLAKSFLAHEIDGVIATNTTNSRTGLEGLRHAEESGGVSGAPLASRSLHVLKVMCDALDDRIPTIAVGGIMTPEDAVARIDAGAKLIQLYTGLIYRGPRLISETARAIG